MNYQKFLSDIAGINFAPELAKNIQNFLFASAKAAIEEDIQLLQERLLRLPQTKQLAPQDQEAITVLQEQMVRELRELEETKDTLKSKITEDAISLDTLPLNFIPQFAWPFRNVKHLQSTLENAPAIIKLREAEFILALLANLHTQKELQIQLEELTDESLVKLINSSKNTYDKAQDERLRNQAQNLAQMAALVIIKRQCELSMAEHPTTNQSQTYIQLLNNLKTKIPDVGSSTILDSISSNQILNVAKYPQNGKKTINQLLFFTRERLGLNNLTWNDPTQMAIMLPSRHLFQQLRFGQEDRRVYDDIRKKNLKKDLFMARSIYDIQQFRNDGISDRAFAQIEERRYKQEIKNKIGQNQLVSSRFYAYYDNPQIIADSKRYKFLNKEASKRTLNAQERAEKKELDEELRGLKLYKDLKSNLRNGDNKQKKLSILNSAYTIKNLEKFFLTPQLAQNNLPCPEPRITVDPNTGVITVEFNYFPNYVTTEAIETFITDAEDQRTYPTGLDIATKVQYYINSRGVAAVESLSLTGENLDEILVKLKKSKFKDYPAVITKFDTTVKNLESSIPKPHTLIDELNITDNQDNARIRALLELRAFFIHARNPAGATKLAASVDLTAQEAKLQTLFTQIDQGDYRSAIQTENIDKIIGETFAWIKELPPDPMPGKCRATYTKAAKIALSASQRTTASDALDLALDSSSFSDSEKRARLDSFFQAHYRHSPASQKEAIRLVFQAEYGSPMAREALDKDQSQALGDIATMAHEYVEFSQRTERGEFSIAPQEELVYLEALEKIAEKIELNRTNLGNLDKIAFKLKHTGGRSAKLTITGENGDTFETSIPLSGPLLYSLSKSKESDHILISYGGSRGAVAALDLTEKSRYFTNWRLYGVGQYGTVKRMDDFVTGEGSVVKSGFIAKGTHSTYPEALRQDPLYRAMTSRDDDPDLEFTILKALSNAKHTVNPSITEHYEYSAEREKPKQMFAPGVNPERFKVLQPLAKGMSYKDMTDSHLSNIGKGDKAYHKPRQIEPSLERSDLKDSLALATAIAEKAAEYRRLGFTHNDLKPENFMTRRRPDGSYIVEFIDWATAGFSQRVVAMQNQKQQFKQLFGVDPSPKPQRHGQGAVTYTAEGGRFLTYQGGNAWYGVNPSLEILHGKRNCTLPYIGPKVVALGEDYINAAQDAGVKDPQFTTHLESNAPTMDDWALTALSFGICNRKAYFKLAHGRAVMDYTVPGVIDAVGNDLVIKDAALFNDYFSPEEGDNLAPESTTIDENPRAVMYIPSTEREGQPIHLYQKLKNALQDTTIELSILGRIRLILTTVHQSVAEGTGLTLENLQTQLTEASDCLHEIEQQKIAQETREKTQAFNAVLEQFSGSRINYTQLLNQADQNAELKNIEILCTYPPTHHDRLEPDPVDDVLAVLDKVDAAWFKTYILSNGEQSPLRNLLQLTIEYQQPKILSALLAKLAGDPQLYPLIAERGLLQYALQQGMTSNAKEMIAALLEADKTKDDILHLLLETYGPSAEKPYITWNKNALHAAIRNNNPEQLLLILDNLPLTQESPDDPVRAAIHEALYFSADLLNSEFFQKISKIYDKTNRRITTEEILSIHIPENGPCPYHFFLRDSATNTNIPWVLLSTLAIDKKVENKELVKRFLKELPHPFVIAASNHNFEGLFNLMRLARSGVLSEEENRSL
ncbi:MAG: hypothetical protein EBY22_06340, partial [Gammaproteobacteria bacterium]|nr:hypothetical protein [Gammaproteobacteria bacterium]